MLRVNTHKPSLHAKSSRFLFRLSSNLLTIYTLLLHWRPCVSSTLSQAQQHHRAQQRGSQRRAKNSLRTTAASPNAAIRQKENKEQRWKHRAWRGVGKGSRCLPRALCMFLGYVTFSWAAQCIAWLIIIIGWSDHAWQQCFCHNTSAALASEDLQCADRKISRNVSQNPFLLSYYPISGKKVIVLNARKCIISEGCRPGMKRKM